MTSIVLRVAMKSLRRHAAQHDWHWSEPHLSQHASDDYTYTWFGNGSQGSEPARFMLCVDQETNRPMGLVIDHDMSMDFTYDFFTAYGIYLQINRWKPRSFTLLCALTWSRVRRLFRQLMWRFNSLKITLRRIAGGS